MRLLDVTLGTVLAVSLAPTEVAARLYLKSILDEGDVVFSQRRIGGLVMHKLRTMYHLAPGEVAGDVDMDRFENPRIPNATVAKMRRLRIDELPQLRQVIRGDMSLVGPRPLCAEAVEHHVDASSSKGLAKRWLSYLENPDVPFGITGPAQVATIGLTDVDVRAMDIRIQEDVHYIETATLATDLAVLAQTADACLRMATTPAALLPQHA